MSDDTEQQLHSDIRSMETRFARLQIATRESIKKRKVPPEDLVANISAYRSFCAVMIGDDQYLADSQKELKSEDNVNKIFTLISPFLSFLDFEILEDIIKDLGADSDRQNLAEYKTSLKDFLNSWKVEPHKIFHDESELGSKVKLCFKLDTKSLSMYRDVKASIARIFKVQVSDLQLYSIKEGCIELVFLIPLEAIIKCLPLKSLSRSFSEVRPRILKIILLDGDRSESVDFRVSRALGNENVESKTYRMSLKS